MRSIRTELADRHGLSVHAIKKIVYRQRGDGGPSAGA